MSYQNPPTSDEDITAVPLITPHLPPTTIDPRSKRRMVAVVGAGMMLLGLAGGAVWLWDEETAAAEGHVVATPEVKHPCLPAPDTFSGISKTAGTWIWSGHKDPFETCYQFRYTDKYCWSHSYYDTDCISSGFECIPEGWYDTDDGWRHDIDPKYVNTPGVDPNTNPKRCGPPCQDMYQQSKWV